MAVTHRIDGDRVTITADVGAAGAVSMPDDEWRNLARSVLRECNAAEYKLSPEVLVQRVRDSLVNAAIGAGDITSDYVSKVHFASSVLHRIADMIKSGTITAATVMWKRETPHLLDVTYEIKMPDYPPTMFALELGKGVAE